MVGRRVKRRDAVRGRRDKALTPAAQDLINGLGPRPWGTEAKPPPPEIMFRPPSKKKRPKADDESIKRFLLRLPKELAEHIDKVHDASPGYSMNATLVYLLKMATAHALGEIEGEKRAKAERANGEDEPSGKKLRR